ncbi:hypothetical protein EYM_01880 [Ignicoccus islandicus DSM 13165]|uniref:Uncharacterized protein n=1 Tax=Ignicoccus islandicus DSM 13165 TaxID=940295 RepID=A0A0U3ECT1_9CREN|nr:hypothetical protein [Ignicoccus islandicus]ALU12259.1 hypothetical protein EYM_01880 [Ignicoccus islandicus DSM 13165]
MVRVKKVVKKRYDKEYIEYHLHVYVPKGFVEICGEEFEVKVDHERCEIRIRPSMKNWRRVEDELLNEEHAFK